MIDLPKREIKYRAWDKVTKTMHEVESVVIYTATESTRLGGNAGEVFYRGEKTSHFYPEEAYLVEFTGLLDKNGKEIYEGDIVRQQLYPYSLQQTEHPYFSICVVQWSDFHMGWAFFQPTVGRYFTDCPGPRHGEPECVRELIGNIFENPELLEKDPSNG